MMCCAVRSAPQGCSTRHTTTGRRLRRSMRWSMKRSAISGQRKAGYKKQRMLTVTSRLPFTVYRLFHHLHSSIPCLLCSTFPACAHFYGSPVQTLERAGVYPLVLQDGCGEFVLFHVPLGHVCD